MGGESMLSATFPALINAIIYDVMENIEVLNMPRRAWNVGRVRRAIKGSVEGGRTKWMIKEDVVELKG